MFSTQIFQIWRCGCGSVGRVVASKTRKPGLKSSHLLTLGKEKPQRKKRKNKFGIFLYPEEVLQEMTTRFILRHRYLAGASIEVSLHKTSL